MAEIHPLPSHDALDTQLDNLAAHLPTVPTEPIAVRYTRLTFILSKLQRDYEAARDAVLAEMESMRSAHPTLAHSEPEGTATQLSPSPSTDCPTVPLGEAIIEACEVALVKHGSITQASKALGIERSTFRRILDGKGAY